MSLSESERRCLRKVHNDVQDGDFRPKRYDNGVIRSKMIMSLLGLGYLAWATSKSMTLTDKGLLALGEKARPVKVKEEKTRKYEDDDSCVEPDFGSTYRTNEEEEARLDREFVPVAFETRRGV